MTAPPASLTAQEMAAAYRAVHGRGAPWLTRKAWESGQMSTATGSIRTAPWYLAATAAERDGQPMPAAPRYMAAARMDAAAGRLRDQRDPLDPSPANSSSLATGPAPRYGADPVKVLADRELREVPATDKAIGASLPPQSPLAVAGVRGQP